MVSAEGPGEDRLAHGEETVSCLHWVLLQGRDSIPSVLLRPVEAQTCLEGTGVMRCRRRSVVAGLD